MNENEKIIQNIKSSLAIEGEFLEKEDEEIINNFLNKEITYKQAIEIIKNQFKG